MHKIWATRGCTGFVVELNIQNISAVESHVSYQSLEAVIVINGLEGGGLTTDMLNPVQQQDLPQGY